MSFGYAPRGWALYNGQLLPSNQNQALFSLLGTTFGGNGQTTFALPEPAFSGCGWGPFPRPGSSPPEAHDPPPQATLQPWPPRRRSPP